MIIDVVYKWHIDQSMCTIWFRYIYVMHFTDAKKGEGPNLREKTVDYSGLSVFA